MLKVKMSKTSPKNLTEAQGALWKMTFHPPIASLQVKCVLIFSPLLVFVTHLITVFMSTMQLCTFQESENRRILPVLFQIKAFPCSSAARKVIGWLQRKGSRVWALGRRMNVGWEILIPFSLVPIVFCLEIWCKIQIHTSRIHRTYSRFDTFAECIKGVWRKCLSLAVFWGTPLYITFLLCPLNMLTLLLFEIPKGLILAFFYWIKHQNQTQKLSDRVFFLIF